MTLGFIIPGEKAPRFAGSPLTFLVYTVLSSNSGTTYGFTIEGSPFVHVAGAESKADIAAALQVLVDADRNKRWSSSVWEFDETKIIFTSVVPVLSFTGIIQGVVADNILQESGDPAPPTNPGESVVSFSNNPYTSMCNQIEADLIALDGPDNTQVTYVRDESEDDETYGVSGSRVFRLEWLGDELMSHQKGLFRYFERFELSITLRRVLKNKRDFDLLVRAEAINVQNRINKRENWPSDLPLFAVDSVQLNDAERRVLDNGDIEVTMLGLLHSKNSIVV